MTQHPQALRVGLFVLSGLALLVAAIALVLGAQVFTPVDRVTMRFVGSVYGLQVGAPVVFRGVQVGRVLSMGLSRNGQGDVVIPVTAALDQEAIQTLGGGEGAAPAALQQLLAQGLSARLATQSLLTGLLYVDLDLRPGVAVSAPPAAGLPDIPTLPTTVQALQAQLQGLDLSAALQDLSAMAAAARQLLTDPHLTQMAAHVTQLTSNVAQLTAQLSTLTQQVQREVSPLTGTVQATLTETRDAVRLVGQAGERVAQTAQRIDAFVAADAPIWQAFERAADELANTAASLRSSVGEDAPLLQQLDRAADEVARAARDLSQLSRMLERQPDALLRGKAAP
jgi:paraquat-inducible protein B